MKLINNIIVKTFSLLGLKISRSYKGLFGNQKKYKWIKDMGIKTVIDIGANNGQSALKFNELFPEAMIYSFEPLIDCYLKLNKRLENVKNFKSFNFALGDEIGESTIFHSKFSPSSSLLKMTKLHEDAFPFTKGEVKEKIRINTLDNVEEGLNLEDNILLKIDVQGFEEKVIKGAKKILNRINIIIIETSFKKLYENQPMFSNIYKLLYEKGFEYSGSLGELINPIDGSILQQDSIFIRM